MKKIIVLLICLSFAITLFGCTEEVDESIASSDGDIAVALVSRVSSNFGSIPVHTSMLTNLLYDAAYRHGRVCIIRDDGSPQVVANYVISAPAVSGLSDERKHTEAEKSVNTILAGFSETVAKEPEVDTLRAIELAAQALAPQTGTKYLVVMDSGLSTTGYLDFTKGYLRSDPEAVVSALERAHAIPNLSDVHVVWLFMGQVEFPQQPLSNVQTDNLRAIWRGILSASGADVEFRDDDRTTPSSLTGLPQVSTVDADERTLDSLPIMETVVLDNSTVRFEGDRDTFSDPPAAVKAIHTVAQSLLQHPESNVLIVGTTAGTKSDDVTMDLSMRRAEAVRATLIKEGIQESRMQCIGLGPNDPFHIADTDSSGHLIEQLAEQNRKVLIIDARSPDAALLSSFTR